jgi:ATP-binding cassette subfamily B (MDR/TAP) protein 1
VKALTFGASIGMLFCLIFVLLAEVLYFGAIYHKYYDVETDDLFTAIFGVIFGAFGMVAISFSFPDMGKASVAMDRVFNILDTPSEINVLLEEGIIPDNFEGRIQCKNVNFSYPTRPEEKVFNDLCVEINPG